MMNYFLNDRFRVMDTKSAQFYFMLISSENSHKLTKLKEKMKKMLNIEDYCNIVTL